MSDIADPTTTPPVEQRAADQDAALEAAFVAGTLPEEDRRASLDEQIAERFAAITSAMPEGSRIVYEAGRFTVSRGRPGVAQVGEGRTLGRAILTIASVYGHDVSGARVLLSESGDVIPLES